MTVINHRNGNYDTINLPADVYLNRIIDKLIGKGQEITVISGKHVHEVLINNVETLTVID